ncbi:peptidyl-tRNA hydrolase ICT1, mitochondrial [Octopus bimaculoides]|uniref:Large ribosomal subunit protein mL62 n=1 Tax=Octopus bimaculoides TaxID=37653 RepID=A0A0L8FNG4_OCTBM|nr:peptidyl-tRNA hydrolase ICT1, mitochondrial [Octopus bimaculoides]|eukprot:XP_014788307.1 PREDICTED: peptidyl-tRNA hydrolase ICT1, mitochondrial-like [Octopus bimaculoides]
MAVSRVRICTNFIHTHILNPFFNRNLRTFSSCNSVASFKSAQSLQSHYPNSNLDPYSPPSSEKSSIDSDNFTGYIPIDKLQISYMKSSGPGGQNVNKVNTKVEVRFHIQSATWIPSWIKTKVIEENHTKINKEGFLIVTSDRTRKQLLNQADCMQKLRNMFFKASFQPAEPSEEDLRIKAEREAKAQRLRIKAKREHSLKKQSRQSSGYVSM